MIEEYNNDKIKVDNIDIKIDNNGINDFNISEKKKNLNRSFKQKKINVKTSISDNNFTSEERLFHVKNQLTIKEEDEIRTIDFMKDKELKESTDNFINNNDETNNKETKKSFFERNFGWLNYLFHEIPLLWKKEELVKGYDANGNVVFRPKNKIPTKETNNVDMEKIKLENDVNYQGLDYTTKAINYGVYFN